MKTKFQANYNQIIQKYWNIYIKWRREMANGNGFNLDFGKFKINISTKFFLFLFFGGIIGYMLYTGMISPTEIWNLIVSVFDKITINL